MVGLELNLEQPFGLALKEERVERMAVSSNWSKLVQMSRRLGSSSICKNLLDWH